MGRYRILIERLRQTPVRKLPGALRNAARKKVRKYLPRVKLFLLRNAARITRTFASSSLPMAQRLALAFSHLPGAASPSGSYLNRFGIRGTKAEIRLFDRQKDSGRLDRPRLIDLQADEGQIASAATRTTLRTQADMPVTLVLAPGASLAALWATPELLDRQLVIYAFDNRKDELANLGLLEQTTLRSLRELFPEISDEAEQLRLASRAFSERFIERLLAGSALQERLGETLALSVEDDVNHWATLLVCIQKAIEAIPEGHEGVVLLHDGPISLEECRALSAPQAASLFALYTDSNEASQRAFLERGLPTPSAATDAAIARVLEHAETMSHSAPIARLPATPFRSERPGILFAFDPIAPAYANAAEAIIRAADQRHDLDLHSVCLRLFPSSEHPGLAEQQARGDHQRVTPVPNLRPSPEDLLVVEAVAREAVAEERLQALKSMTSTVAGEAVLRRLPGLFAVESFVRTHLRQARPNAVLTTAGRSWAVRQIGASFKHLSDVPVIDFQVLNVLKQAKYRIPAADAATVIDMAARDVYSTFLGMDESSITVTGTPADDIRFDSSPRPSASLDGLRILFASQLLPFEDRIEPVLRAVGEYLERDNAATLVVKLHPRETDARIDQYNELFSELGLAGRVQVSSDINIAGAIAQSNVCITFYSNVGREAQAAGLPVLAALFGDWDPPMRLDREGIARKVGSRDELVDHLETLAAAGVPAKEPSARQAPEATSSDRILDVAIELASPSQKERIEPASHSFFVRNHKDAASVLKSAAKDGTIKVSRWLSLKGFDRSVVHPDIDVSDLSYRTDTSELFKSASDASVAMGHALSERVHQTSIGSSIAPSTRRSQYAIGVFIRSLIVESYIREAFIGHEIDRMGETAKASCGVPDPAFVRSIEYALHERSRPGLAGLHLTGSATHFLSPRPAPVRDPQAVSLEVSGEPVLPVASFKEGGGRKTAVVTTAWKLKTVPGSILPVLERLVDQGYRLAVLDLYDTPTAELEQAVHALDNESICIGLSSLSPSGASPLLKVPDKVFGSGLVDASIATALESLATTGLHQILTWCSVCEELLKPEGSISIACPGRQWHADLAHDVAKALGRKSVTVQNAYMSANYTYMKPRGDLLTAIDERQKDLFIEEFGADPASIEVVGTPRFDALARSSSHRDPQDHAKDESSLPRILYAAQPGIEDVAIRAVNALIEKMTVPCEVMVKLHPRTTDLQARQFEEQLLPPSSDVSVSVVKEIGIEEAIGGSDVVLTAFSNAGLEAALMGRPVIYTTYHDWYAFIGSTDCGFRTNDEGETVAAVLRALTGEQGRSEIMAPQERFLGKHKAIRNGASADMILELITQEA